MEIKIVNTGENNPLIISDLLNVINKYCINEIISPAVFERSPTHSGEMSWLGEVTNTIVTILKAGEEPITRLVECLLKWVEVSGNRKIEMRKGDKVLIIQGNKIDKNVKALVESFFNETVENKMLDE
jgi:hypothetical protein